MALFSFLDMATFLILAASPGQCTYAQAPMINIRPTTAPVQYDFTKTATQLTALQSDTISPYGLSVDVTTKGLRHDRPFMEYRIEFGTSVDQKYGSFCIWYKDITLDIKLQPKIYIAKEYNVGDCGKFILEHEKKHVRVDREVMNKYAALLGKSIQNAVNLAGAQGPYNYTQAEEVRQSMKLHIDSAIQSVMLLMQGEMNRRQQAIDSLQEYEAGRIVCKGVTTP